MDDSALVIRVENVSKVFWRHFNQTLEMQRAEQSKVGVERTTNCTIGTVDANFEVHPHEILVRIGMSGSGKSTLLRLINRLSLPPLGRSAGLLLT